MLIKIQDKLYNLNHFMMIERIEKNLITMHTSDGGIVYIRFDHQDECDNVWNRIVRHHVA